ncbi:hypothetical protein BVRB_018390, partial [Beta vulgaris subsp. vulgaris]
MEAGK